MALDQALRRLQSPSAPRPPTTVVTGPGVGAPPATHLGVSGVTAGRAAPTPVRGKVAWAETVELRRRASDEITRLLESDRESSQRLSDEDRRARGRSVIRQVVHRRAEELAAQGRELWDADREQAHVQAVHDAIYGYGRLQPVFEIAEAENIEIHGYDSVMAQFGDGHREQLEPVADSDEELVDAIRFLGELASPPRPFDDAHPMMTIAVGERFRLHAIGFGLSHRPSVIIRQHILTDVTLAELSDGGMMPEHVARLLRAAVRGRLSMVVSGDQGAGKTTLLRALIDAIPQTERFGTIETDYELLTHLQPRRRNMLALQARVGLGETQDGRTVGSWSVADLIPEALRQNLSRLVVGEVRGSEAGAMFEAMMSGAGTLSTTHAHSAASTLDRLASRVAQGGTVTIPEAYRQIAHNIGLVIHVSLVDDTWRGGVRRRHISEIRSLTGAIEGDRPVTHLVYRAAEPGQPEIFHPEPELVERLSPFDTDWSPRRDGSGR
ncbi:ATPase, T2SS/T4P/T4SS family [Aestuariimicrobium kwangyangense]|uniref:CpaF family protein n=1 Tax=Aestuariimicrobium kwangyangense TaxID=396389 RepID=UPI0006878BE0